MTNTGESGKPIEPADSGHSTGDKRIVQCPECVGKGSTPPGPEWGCGCGPHISHVADCGRPRPKSVTCRQCMGMGRIIGRVGVSDDR